MSAVAISIRYERLDPSAPFDLDRLHRAVWSCVASGMRDRVSSEAARRVLVDYVFAYTESGFDEERWRATDDTLSYSFGDAAGLCALEMEATHHFAQMVLWNDFIEIDRLARTFGASLARPTSVEDTVAEGRQRVFFVAQSKVVSARANRESTGAELVSLGDHEIRLGDLPSTEREHVLGLVRRGLCGCDVCESIRDDRGLPLAAHVTRGA